MGRRLIYPGCTEKSSARPKLGAGRGGTRGASHSAALSVQGRMSDSRKQSLYFPEEMLQEIQQEAVRLDRSLSWIVQHAWRAARAHVATMPGTAEIQATRR